MLIPIAKNFKGLITISGPTKSGKSQLAEFLIKDHECITYIATSKPRENDPEWKRRIDIHRKRRPDDWKIIEHPSDICNVIESIGKEQTILIDSLGGLIEQYIMTDENSWNLVQNNFINCLKDNNNAIIVVSEEIGWGLVPPTKIGHLFRERLTILYSLISSHSTQKWLAINGTAIELDKIGSKIP